MSTNANGNDLAFPIFISGEWLYYGLTKRELFAAMAMQGILADPKVSDIGNAAIHAVEAADALLAALAEEADA